MDTAPDPPEIRSIADVLEHARIAYDALAALGEDVEDEWSYVTDLAAAWTERLDEVAAARGDEPAGDGVAAAVLALADEAGQVDDPHRAIDWLSTFPQILLVAIGERP
ncbi:MAG TPA: hypothetical protein VFI34_05075 [Candidatus Limnocylindrales bacterium]|nr:hypothetical protein [Candidatus Limnocylindrales bacterium]